MSFAIILYGVSSDGNEQLFANLTKQKKNVFFNYKLEKH